MRRVTAAGTSISVPAARSPATPRVAPLRSVDVRESGRFCQDLRRDRGRDDCRRGCGAGIGPTTASGGIPAPNKCQRRDRPDAVAAGVRPGTDRPRGAVHVPGMAAVRRGPGGAAGRRAGNPRRTCRIGCRTGPRVFVPSVARGPPHVAYCVTCIETTPAVRGAPAADSWQRMTAGARRGLELAAPKGRKRSPPELGAGIIALNGQGARSLASGP